MKLAVALVASVVANSNKKFGKNKKKPQTGVTRSTPESCVATFNQLSAEFTPTSYQETSPSLDVFKSPSGTSGHIDIHNYGDDTNCYIEVVADESCQEITAEIIHAGLERCDDDCTCDKFWFNNESTPDDYSLGGTCGCGGISENPADGDGCNDNYDDDDDDTWADQDYIQEIGVIGDWGNRVFSDNKFVFSFYSDGSYSQGNVRIEWTCTKQAPTGPTNPLELLQQLVNWSAEVINDAMDGHKYQNKWLNKFANNANRMTRSFNRCGVDSTPVDAEPEWESYDNSDSSLAIADITTGFRKWADAYLAECYGHKTHNHQQRRMAKWNTNIQKHL